MTKFERDLQGTWDHDSIVYAAFLWARMNGRWPKPNDWHIAAEDHPTNQTVHRYFRDWDEMIFYAQDLAQRVLKSQGTV